jgi:tRNA-specific 2-thiouridylase
MDAMPTKTTPPTKAQKVAVGMSGGVDSAVSALLLKRAGYEVIGLFMKNWEETDPSGMCQSAKDYEDVAAVCDKIGIAYYSVNFAQQYWDLVFAKFLSELKMGYTPNPDILCNKEIKFHLFLQKAFDLGAAFLATGHYGQIREGALYKGADPRKDQSYFLYTLQQEVLQKVLFPVGHLQKQQVRSLAYEAGLPVHSKKDSTGICFIGKRDFKEFISRYIAYQKGPFETLEGKVIGEHDGAAYYTIGQRKGLGIGGPGEAWFVAGKDMGRNAVILVQGEEHPALYAQELIATEPSWAIPNGWMGKAKIRYRQQEQACTVTSLPGGELHVCFTQPQRAITPRQAIVFYEEDKCVGGALIARALK